MDKPRSDGASPKVTLGVRIIISYLILLLVAFIIAGVSFNALTRQYLIREAKNNLHEQGKVLVSLYRKNPWVTTQRNPRSTRILADLVDAEMVIVDKKGQIVVSNRPQRFPVEGVFNHPELNKVLEGGVVEALWKDRERDVVAVGLPMRTEDNALTGAVFLFTHLSGIELMSKEITVELTKGLLASAVFALIVGIFMSRSISKPTAKLKAAALALAERKYDAELPVERGDELGEVARSFAIMRQRLQDYDETQRRFLQTTSHELKTPLMSIQGYAEGIKDGVFEGDEVEKGLNVIVSESQRLKKIVDEMILLSKLESLDGIYTFQPLTLMELADGAIDKLKGLAAELKKDVSVVAQGDTRLFFRGDKDKLAQAVINLVSNGLRHAKQSVRVVVGERTLSVIDDGDGIDPQEAPKIFQRFYKGERGDTGLGLSIALAIVERHGGTITVINESSGGARFEIEFPSHTFSTNFSQPPHE